MTSRYQTKLHPSRGVILEKGRVYQRRQRRSIPPVPLYIPPPVAEVLPDATVEEILPYMELAIPLTEEQLQEIQEKLDQLEALDQLEEELEEIEVKEKEEKQKSEDKQSSTPNKGITVKRRGGPKKTRKQKIETTDYNS